VRIGPEWYCFNADSEVAKSGNTFWFRNSELFLRVLVDSSTNYGVVFDQIIRQSNADVAGKRAIRRQKAIQDLLISLMFFLADISRIHDIVYDEKLRIFTGPENAVVLNPVLEHIQQLPLTHHRHIVLVCHHDWPLQPPMGPAFLRFALETIRDVEGLDGLEMMKYEDAADIVADAHNETTMLRNAKPSRI